MDTDHEKRAEHEPGVTEEQLQQRDALLAAELNEWGEEDFSPPPPHVPHMVRHSGSQSPIRPQHRPMSVNCRHVSRLSSVMSSDKNLYELYVYKDIHSD